MFAVPIDQCLVHVWYTGRSLSNDHPKRETAVCDTTWFCGSVSNAYFVPYVLYAWGKIREFYNGYEERKEQLQYVVM